MWLSYWTYNHNLFITTLYLGQYDTNILTSLCHSNPVLVPNFKPHDPMKDIYYCQTYYLKTRVYILTKMDVVPVEYGTFFQTFHLTMWFYQSINGVALKWYCIQWCIIGLLVWIGLWTKLRIYIVLIYPLIWSFRGFGYLWWAFIMLWILMFNN